MHELPKPAVFAAATRGLAARAVLRFRCPDHCGLCAELPRGVGAGAVGGGAVDSGRDFRLQERKDVVGLTLFPAELSPPLERLIHLMKARWQKAPWHGWADQRRSGL